MSTTIVNSARSFCTGPQFFFALQGSLLERVPLMGVLDMQECSL